MNIQQIVAELQEERRHVDQAILVLQRIAAGQGRRRGRPPKWMSESTIGAATPRKRRPFSPETRAKMAAAQRKGWAAKRKAQKAA